mmetsp:Transcript_7427/g.14526  ORF Transcript_7427/g.14526 Transcript_7427/m.14526 type:complete len:232 (-) Transcript_7427:76-771(-)
MREWPRRMAARGRGKSSGIVVACTALVGTSLFLFESQPDSISSTKQGAECVDHATKAGLLRFRGGGLDDYAKWDKIKVSDDDVMPESVTGRDISSVELRPPPADHLACVQGNWTTSGFKGDTEYPSVTGRMVSWRGTKERSGIYLDTEKNALYLNGWLMDTVASNWSRVKWVLKDPKHQIDDFVYWQREVEGEDRIYPPDATGPCSVPGTACPQGTRRTSERGCRYAAGRR